MATISKASAGALELWDRIYLTEKLPELFSVQDSAFLGIFYKHEFLGVQNSSSRKYYCTVPSQSERVWSLNEVRKIKDGILTLGT